MQRLIINQPEEDLTSHAGLGLIGRALNECTNLAADAKVISPLRSQAQLTPLANGWMPLDCNVTPFDNSHTTRKASRVLTTAWTVTHRWRPI